MNDYLIVLAIALLPAGGSGTCLHCRHSAACHCRGHPSRGRRTQSTTAVLNNRFCRRLCLFCSPVILPSLNGTCRSAPMDHDVVPAPRDHNHSAGRSARYAIRHDHRTARVTLKAGPCSLLGASLAARLHADSAALRLTRRQSLLATGIQRLGVVVRQDQCISNKPPTLVALGRQNTIAGAPSRIAHCERRHAGAEAVG